MADSATPRREPQPDRRRRDAEATKRKLLSAGLDEFASRGYAGARVSEIAANAGVNKQLISYYFGGKAGLYRAIQRSWLDEEEDAQNREMPAAEQITWYLESMARDPRGIRLAMWRSLSDDGPDLEEPGDVEREQEMMRRRQNNGEIPSDMDPAALQLVFMGMTIAPIVFPGLAEKLFGTPTDSAEFIQRYGETLRRIVSRLS